LANLVAFVCGVNIFRVVAINAILVYNLI